MEKGKGIFHKPVSEYVFEDYWFIILFVFCILDIVILSFNMNWFSVFAFVCKVPWVLQYYFNRIKVWKKM